MPISPSACSRHVYSDARNQTAQKPLLPMADLSLEIKAKHSALRILWPQTHICPGSSFRSLGQLREEPVASNKGAAADSGSTSVLSKAARTLALEPTWLYSTRHSDAAAHVEFSTGQLSLFPSTTKNTACSIRFYSMIFMHHFSQLGIQQKKNKHLLGKQIEVANRDRLVIGRQ